MNTISILKRQFNFGQFLRELTVKIVQKVLSPNTRFYYSQTGEDTIILSLLNSKTKGVYVDVGCHKPIEKSNTFLLYKNGWSGIAIDANQDLINNFRKIRPRDIAICQAVSDIEGEVEFHEFEESAVSTISNSILSEWKENWVFKQTKKVRAKPLTSILQEHNISKQIDLLSIDVEGHDFEVLKSLDLSLYNPYLIVIEIHEFNLYNFENNPVVSYLKDKDYMIVGFVMMNAYFMRLS